MTVLAEPVAFDDVRPRDLLLIDGRKTRVEAVTDTTLIVVDPMDEFMAPKHAPRADLLHTHTRSEFAQLDARRIPRYTVTYDTPHAHRERRVSADFIERSFGPLIIRLMDRGEAWNFAVLDDQGQDITAEFPVFAAHE